MSTGVIYNTFLCFITFILSIMAFYKVRKTRRKGGGKEYSEFLDYFLLLLGILWGFVTITFNVFIFKWFTGPLIYIHLLPAFYYFGWSFFSKKKRIHILFNTFFTLMVFLTVLTFFIYGFVPEGMGYWGGQYKINNLTNNIFMYWVFIPAFVCIIIDFFRRFKNWNRTKSPSERELLGFDFGFLIYGLAGILDSLGVLHDWFILLSRIGTMMAPMIFYLSATWELED